MLCINISVNAMAHCMLVKHADIYTCESQNMGVSSKTGNKLSQMSAVLTHHAEFETNAKFGRNV